VLRNPAPLDEQSLTGADMRLPGVVFALAAGLMSVGFDIGQIRREKRHRFSIRTFSSPD